MGFWSKIFGNKKLEELVKNFNSFQEQYNKEKGDFEAEKAELRRRAEEAEAKLKQDEANRNVLIQYFPGKELYAIIDGAYLYSDDISQERFEELSKLRQEKDVLGIKKLLIPNFKVEEVEKTEEIIKEKEKYFEERGSEIPETQKVIESVSIIIEDPEFEVVDNVVKMVGIDRSIPKALVNKFGNLAKENTPESKKEFIALKNFWRWIVLNPNAKATEEFYKLIEKYNVRVTKEGFVLAYRWVRSLDKKVPNKVLIESVSLLYTKIKKNKKSPKNYEVYKDNGKKEYFVQEIGKNTPKDRDKTKCVSEGNLLELYQNLASMQGEQMYTDGHTGTMKIKIGEEVSMDRKDCDESGSSCSRGLHAAFNINDYSAHGNTKILVAVCPRDIVSVPYSESKFRCCKYLPLAALKDKHTDANFLKTGEGLDLLEGYFQIKVEELKTEAEKFTVKELTKNHLLPERLAKVEEVKADEEIETIVETLESQLPVLDSRVKTLEK